MKKKRNNKGFSLVELIVVMAIMAILAVTLAPRLMQYVDKARQANDREVANSIYSIMRLALVDDTMYKAATSITNISDPTKGLNFNDADTTAPDGTPIHNIKSLYDVASKSWTINTDAGRDNKDNIFLNELTTAMGGFKLQSNKADSASQITIFVVSETNFSVVLDYDGLSTSTNDRYTVSSTAVYN